MINLEKIKEFLPHRDPFLFLDKIEAILVPGRDMKPGDILSAKETIGVEVAALYRTKEDHPIFAGHFPGNPILPGVVQVEMMAQAASFTLFYQYEDPYKVDMDVALLAVNNAKFRKPILPEMDLTIKSKLTKVRGSMFSHECQIFHNGELMSQADTLAAIKEK